MVQVNVVATTTGQWLMNTNGNVFTFSNSSTASGTGDINAVDEVVQKAVKESQILNFINGHRTLANRQVQQVPNFSYNTEDISHISNTTVTTHILK